MLEQYHIIGQFARPPPVSLNNIKLTSFFSAFHSILTNKIIPHSLLKTNGDYNGIVEKLPIFNQITPEIIMINRNRIGPP